MLSPSLFKESRTGVRIRSHNSATTMDRMLPQGGSTSSYNIFHSRKIRDTGNSPDVFRCDKRLVMYRLQTPIVIDRIFRDPLCGAAGIRERVLFIGTQCSNLYTSVDTPDKGRVGGGVVFVISCKYVLGQPQVSRPTSFRLPAPASVLWLSHFASCLTNLRRTSP